MRPSPLVLSPVLALLLVTGAAAQEHDLRIPLPKRDITTPVQKLNREGVKLLKKHKLVKARQYFYRAYLLDPNDPFTLNNLGYISEMGGDIDRAERYYELSAANTSDATVAMATLPEDKGKTIAQVAGHVGDNGMQINRYNVVAMGLLMKNRAPEADMVLQKALALDPHNPFTLNNMGYAKEKEGEYEQAFAAYSRAANSGSDQRIIVAMRQRWRGRRISDVARDNARALSKLMETEDSQASRVARLNLQGVSAINRNDRATARQDFERAYKLAPDDAFTLNNMGYVSELDGDRESADFYYEKAQEANKNGAIAAVATRKEVEGKPIRAVAEFGDNVISTRMEADREARAAEGGPVVLRRRDGSVVVDPDKPPPQIDEDSIQPPAETPPKSNQGGGVMPPLPESKQPATSNQPPWKQPATNQRGIAPVTNPGGVMPPLPDNQQPPPANQPNQPAVNPGNVMPPLPDNQQPPAAKPNTQPPPNQAKPKQGAVVDGIMQPLPDNEQPQQKPPQSPPK